MAWYIDSTRIFVQDWRESGNQIIPRLQPLSGGTVKQIFGYETPITKITGLAVGFVDEIAILEMTQDGNTHTLDSPYGVLGSFEVKAVSATIVKCICQTLRPDLPEDAPVFNIDVEFYE